jgi:hypothetical protein
VLPGIHSPSNADVSTRNPLTKSKHGCNMAAIAGTRTLNTALEASHCPFLSLASDSSRTDRSNNIFRVLRSAPFAGKLKGPFRR